VDILYRTVTSLSVSSVLYKQSGQHSLIAWQAKNTFIYARKYLSKSSFTDKFAIKNTEIANQNHLQ
jgi:hypothetical protein